MAGGYERMFEDPANDPRVGGEGEAVELGQAPSLLSYDHPSVAAFGRSHTARITDVLPSLTACGMEGIYRTRLLLSCLQQVKRVKVGGKRVDGLQADGQRPIFNLHRRVKAAAYKVDARCKDILEHVENWIMWWAKSRGLRLASLKILENAEPGWTAYRLGRPAYMRAAFHLPLAQDCDSGLLVEKGSDAAAERAVISDERGQTALLTSLTGLEAPGWRVADAVRGHCLSVIVDLVHALA